MTVGRRTERIPKQKYALQRILLVLGFLFMPAAASANFITTWKTDNPGDSNDDQITIPTNGAGYNYDIDWGDGNADFGVTGDITHTYASPGTYTVEIRGTFPQIFFDNLGDKDKILSVEQWGNISWRAMNRTFYGCQNLVINAADTPDLSSVTNMNQMFRLTNFNDDIGDWDVGNVTTMSNLFTDNPNFNQDLNLWDVSNVTIMSSMFLRATSFNGDISKWDTGAVVNMNSMFHTASSFNQDISAWDTTDVTIMRNMFFRAEVFDQPIGAWDVSNVTDMQAMFREARVFNQDISSWNTQNVETMRLMFSNANAFNQPIGAWDTGKVTTMVNMFQFATVFNQDISLWNTAAVTTMQQMFQNAPAFNQEIGSWDTGMVTTMRLMFDDATAFDGDIGAWNTGMVTDMAFMFRDAANFNQDIGGWNTSMVATMQQMFFRASQFNQDIGAWNTGMVTNMNTMFRLANSFDQDLGGWDVTSLTNAGNMFLSIALSTANYDSLLIGWDAQALNNGVNFHGGNSNYCLAESERATMIAADGWNINDGGLDCGNEAPTDIEIDGANSDSITENAPVGTNIGVLTTTDPDAGDTHTYSLACAVAGADDALFQLSGDTLQNATVFDFESPADANSDGIYEVCVRTADDGTPSESYDEILQIMIDNERPDLSITKAVDIDEPEVGQTVTFTLMVSNLSGDGATSLQVVDIVPPGFTYAGVISGGDAQDDSSPTGSGLEWTINSLLPSDPAVSLQFEALVNAP